MGAGGGAVVGGLRGVSLLLPELRAGEPWWE